MAKKNKISGFLKKITRRFRLVLVDEDTYQEKTSFRVSFLNLTALVGFISVFFMGLMMYVIATTGLKEYIPGFSSAQAKRELAEILFRADSITLELKNNSHYLNSVKKVLTGNITLDSLKVANEYFEDSLSNAVDPINLRLLMPSKEDSLFRENMERQNRYNILDVANNNEEINMFKPVEGSITNPFNMNQKHFGVDISIQTNTPVKSVAEGMVIFAEWTYETGYVIMIKHTDNLVTIYKHNQSLNKEIGDNVRLGEVISFSGSTGHLTTGPHLHLEIWGDGYPLNPEDFINFK